MRIHGQVHHYVGALNLAGGQQHRYAQMYILDAQQALEQRLRISYSDDLNPGLF